MNTQHTPAPNIDWKPLEAVPADRLDGRDTLLWKEAPIVANNIDGSWLDPVGRPIIGATHYADVEGPGQ